MSHSCPPKSEGGAGFTLLELLVAVTLTGIVVTLVLAGFQAGVQAYRRGVTRTELLHEARGGFRLLETDLERALPTVQDNYPRFAADRLTFAAGLAAPELGVESITYRFVDNAIERATTGSSTDAVAFAVIRGVEAASFQYLVQEGWVDELGEADAQPVAVRLNLALTHGGQRRSFTSVLAFPSVGELPGDAEVARQFYGPEPHVLPTRPRPGGAHEARDPVGCCQVRWGIEPRAAGRAWLRAHHDALCAGDAVRAVADLRTTRTSQRRRQ